jgi:hypothetical protein
MHSVPAFGLRRAWDNEWHRSFLHLWAALDAYARAVRLAPLKRVHGGKCRTQSIWKRKMGVAPAAHPTTFAVRR